MLQDSLPVVWVLCLPFPRGGRLNHQDFQPKKNTAMKPLGRVFDICLSHVQRGQGLAGVVTVVTVSLWWSGPDLPQPTLPRQKIRALGTTFSSMPYWTVSACDVVRYMLYNPTLCSR